MKTFSDQVTQLGYTFMIDQVAKDRMLALSNIAVRTCYQEIGAKWKWFYLKKIQNITLTAPYSTGTVTYVAATRTLTLTGGTWPSWVLSGELLINRNIYQIDSMTSSTVLVLTDGACPVVDISVATGYQLVQSSYLMPANYVELLGITEIERLWVLVYIPPEEMLARTQLWFSPSNSYFFTIMGGQNGRMIMKFNPPPALARTLYICYQAAPRPPVMITPYQSGTLSTTANSNVVTLTPVANGPVLPTNLFGCVLRIGTAGKIPDGPFTENPPQEEHVIRSVSGNTITLQDNCRGTYPAARFIIDDPIDLDLPTVHTYFDRMCESRLARIHQMDIQRIADCENAELMALRCAIANDSKLDPKVLQQGLRTTGINEMLMGMVNNPGGP